MSLSGFAIAGLHKLTTLDFPGVVSAIVFTQGCNLHCPYCHNPHLIPTAGKSPLLDVDHVFGFFRKRAGLLDGIVISGGEPCLQPGLADFCRETKSLGFAVKLDTNGSRPDVLSSLLADELVDYVAMDCKTALGSYYPLLSNDTEMGTKVLRSMKIVRESGVGHEFRTTCVVPFVTPEILPDMATGMARDSAWFLQPARLDASMLRRGLRACSKQEISEMAELAGRQGGLVQIRE